MASCASDGTTGFGPGTSAEQAVHTPNDEERLEQMSHPKNQSDGTDDAPRKVEWTCLGLHDLAMERWNGLAWVCMEWLWKGLARCGGEGSSGTTVFPQTQRVRLVSLCVGVTEPLPFLPSGQAMET